MLDMKIKCRKVHILSSAIQFHQYKPAIGGNGVGGGWWGGVCGRGHGAGMLQNDNSTVTTRYENTCEVCINKWEIDMRQISIT